MEKQEYLLQLSFLQQEAEKIEEQSSIITQQILELKKIQENLSDIEKNHKAEILAPLGKGIFFKSELKEKELFVNIGSNIVLKKSPEQTIELVSLQISKLEEIKADLQQQMNRLHEVLEQIIEHAQKEQVQKS